MSLRMLALAVFSSTAVGSVVAAPAVATRVADAAPATSLDQLLALPFRSSPDGSDVPAEVSTTPSEVGGPLLWAATEPASEAHGAQPRGEELRDSERPRPKQAGAEGCDGRDGKDHHRGQAEGRRGPKGKKHGHRAGRGSGSHGPKHARAGHKGHKGHNGKRGGPRKGRR